MTSNLLFIIVLHVICLKALKKIQFKFLVKVEF